LYTSQHVLANIPSEQLCSFVASKFCFPQYVLL